MEVRAHPRPTFPSTHPTTFRQLLEKSPYIVVFDRLRAMRKALAIALSLPTRFHWTLPSTSWAAVASLCTAPHIQPLFRACFRACDSHIESRTAVSPACLLCAALPPD